LLEHAVLDSLASWPDIAVLHVRESHLQKDTVGVALLARRTHADVVIWGWYDVSEQGAVVTVETYIAPFAPRGMPELHGGQFTATRQEFDRFEPQRGLARGISAAAAVSSGMAAALGGDFARAIPRLEVALRSGAVPRSDGSEATLLATLVRGYGAVGLDSVAVARAEAAISLDSTRSDVWADMALSLDMLGDPERADRAYSRALSLERLPGPRAVICINWAASLLDRGEAKEALEDTRMALTLAPKSAVAHLLQSRCFAMLQDFDGTMRALDESVASDPDWTPARYTRGTLRAQQGQLWSAIDDYSRAIDNWDRRSGRFGNLAVRMEVVDGPKLGELYALRSVVFGRLGDTRSAVRDSLLADWNGAIWDEAGFLREAIRAR
jgi:tetratricopeptide (TPR) repeat protein